MATATAAHDLLFRIDSFPMPTLASRTPRLGADLGWLDRAGMGISALCVAHCLTSAIVVTALASFGGVLLSPIIHEVGLAIAIILGAIALGVGVMRHGYVAPFATGCFGLGMMAGAISLHGSSHAHELMATLAGVLTLALAHDLNGRARG